MINYLRCRLAGLIGLRHIKEYPLVFLAILFAMLSIYNLASLRVSASGVDETHYGVNIVQPVNNIVGESLYTLKKKMEIIYGRHAVQEHLLRLSAVPAASPFDIAPADAETTKYIVEESPPEVRVRAVAISDKDKVALLDIGDIKGKLVRERDLFGAGLGIVRQINHDSVVLNWNGKQFCALLQE